VARHAAALAARQFGHVGVLLLRHDRRARAEAVGQVDEADARRHPDDELFRQARDVRHHQRGCRAELDGEVAVGHRVERVLAHAFEAQRAGHPFAVDRVTGAGECRGTERQPIDPAPAIGQALDIAREHFHIGHQVMAEGDRLGHLQMRESRHDRAGVKLGDIEQRALQVAQQAHRDVDLGAQPQPDVGGDLVISRTRRVQSFAGIARQIGEALLDIQMDVFEVDAPAERTVLDVGPDARHAIADRIEIGLGQQAAGVQHVGVRQRTLDVVESQALVEIDRCGVAFHQLGYRL
jgi:hypothetical protein